ncbi:MAG: mitochondrial fission ELM1 family protein [Pseudomonadota bacterium]
MSEVAEIWVLTDGRAGNVAQALGLAEAIGRQRPVHIVQKTIGLNWLGRLVPPGLAVRFRANVDGWPFNGLSQGADDLQGPWPNMVIGAGRRSAPVVAALRSLHGVTAVQMLDPQCPPTAFDAVIVPAHDQLAGANVLTTLGAVNRITSDRIAAAAEDWGRLADRPHVAVLIGGPSRSATFSEADAENLALALEALSAEHDLVVTTSRRTPVALAEQIACLLAGRGVVWTGEGPNPYPAMLSGASAVLVTEDSVNMASEAATAGVPVHVFSLTRIHAKFAEFHRALFDHGASRQFNGALERWDYAPLAEGDRIAGELIRRGLI